MHRVPPIVRHAAIGLAVAAFLAPAALAAPPTADEIAAMDEKLGEWFNARRSEGMERQEIMAGMATYADELLGELDYSDMTTEDIVSLQSMLQLAEANAERARARLAELASDNSVDGAVAAITACELAPRRDRAALDSAVDAAVRHPALGDAVRDGRGAGIFRMLGRIDADRAASMKDELLALSDAIGPALDARTLMGLTDFVTTVCSLEGVSEARTDALRDRTQAAMRAAAEKAEDERMAAALKSGADFLNGAFARGKLMNHTAPALNFTWSSSPEPITSLAALKGKVIVLDFWATWCGPCIGSFPNVRELQKHYEGYDVAIIGITSLQGRHFGGGEPIDTEGNPQKEFELMKEFMGQKDMTWTVAFTEQDTFNPDFGVRGIPHVAIIDPEGTVRYNGLHPSSPLSEKTKKINALLEKAGLPVPIDEQGE
ncbi:MAG: TlpA family protein disulfide reductase [Planctomycetota bacterium]|jgi:thiol-disulfide isomerase/thioredoxin